eukprot:CAMPEP_0117587780 /NCGR_PEP_ID=MMETSP0784-20121206/69490_1 /TAXON_ID=39447 /ORGANISM="" /LENGTH=280 /DNA_ID=CAMNT_0005389075 /DNA_START=41 /DNA_END=886 /DNA_ORIENTATION=-
MTAGAAAVTTGLKASLHGLQPEAALAAIRTLDTDHSGKIEKAEVEAFALQQGLTAEQVNLEFKDLDTNGDGELDSSEIGTAVDNRPDSPDAEQAVATLGAPAPLARATVAPARAAPKAAAPTELAPPAPTAALAVAETATAPAPQVDLAKGLLQEGTTIQRAKQEANRALAEAFARSASSAFTKEQEDERRAAELQESARHLRGRAAEIASSARQLVAKAAADAATAVFVSAASQVQQLEQQASKFDREAGDRRVKVRQAMDDVEHAQQQMRDVVLPPTQ